MMLPGLDSLTSNRSCISRNASLSESPAEQCRPRKHSEITTLKNIKVMFYFAACCLLTRCVERRNIYWDLNLRPILRRSADLLFPVQYTTIIHSSSHGNESFEGLHFPQFPKPHEILLRGGGGRRTYAPFL